MRKSNAGQTVLIALLIGLVVLTIGLGVASRAITDIKLSRQEEESSRAFNIAEAGIEELLKEPTLVAGPPITETIGDITRDVYVYEEGDLEILVEPNETVEIDVSVIARANLDIYWVQLDKGEDPGICSEGSGEAPASIEVMIYKEISGNYSVERLGLNSCSGLGNGFSDEVEDGRGKGFLAKKRITTVFLNGDRLVRIRVLYHKATLRVESDPSLGAQMYRITSRAQAPVGETRQVEVERTKPGLPAIFDYVLFSGSSLVGKIK